MINRTLVEEIKIRKWSSDDIRKLREEKKHISVRDWNKALLAAFQ